MKQLNAFFTVLNAGRDKPFDWAGNEPSLWTPWEYDYFGAPWRTQAVVREIADQLYTDTPANEPGNDDLGALSSWYVWAAIGLYPVTPGSANLALASPLFPNISITLGDGHHLVERAPAASASTPYVHSLTITGGAGVVFGPVLRCCLLRCSLGRRASRNLERPWVPASILRPAGLMSFDLSRCPTLLGLDPGSMLRRLDGTGGCR